MLYKTEGFPVTIVRPYLIYGPNQDSQRFLPQIVKGCIDNKSFPTSKGEQLRDFCYVDDFSKCILAVLNKKKCFGEIFNIGSGKPVKIIDVIKKIKRKVGKGNPVIGKIPYRKMENMKLYPDISKIKKYTKWKPKVSLSEGLDSLIKHYKT